VPLAEVSGYFFPAPQLGVGPQTVKLQLLLERGISLITMNTVVNVKGITSRIIYNFMLNCTDDAYQNWWPETHLAFHTKGRFANNLGNIVFFDEYVGKRRLKFDGIVVKVVQDNEIVWQMKKIVKLPAWLSLELKEKDNGVEITHTIKVGFSGIGELLDPILRLYLTPRFKKDLEDHAHFEFTRLAEILCRNHAHQRVYRIADKSGSR
jgi:hypothetical protein